jgi:hypothetical protein
LSTYRTGTIAREKANKGYELKQAIVSGYLTAMVFGSISPKRRSTGTVTAMEKNGRNRLLIISFVRE